MGQLTLKGGYRTKGFINFLGWRIHLWNREGTVDHSFDLIKNTELQQTVRVPGPIDVTLSIERSYGTAEPYNLVVTAHSDGKNGIVFFRHVQPLPDAQLTVPIRFNWNGNAFDGHLFVRP
jgi:hypothetical protein